MGATVGSGPVISVLVASRRRPQLLARMAESLVTHARDAKSFEILIACDSDDIQSLQVWAELPPAKDAQWRAIVVPRMGYANLHVYYNALADIATGDWLLLLGDDTFVVTHGWDDLLADKPCDRIINTGNPNDRNYSRTALMHPAVPRAWHRIMGRIAAYSQFDTYLYAVGTMAARIEMPWLFDIGHVAEGAGPSDRIADEVTREISYATELPIEEAVKDAELIKAHYSC